MPNHVLQIDCTSGSGEVGRNLGTPYSELWAEYDVAFNATFLTDLIAQPYSWILSQIYASASYANYQSVEIWHASATVVWTSYAPPTGIGYYTPAAPVTDLQFYRVKLHVTAGSPNAAEVWIDGVSIGTIGLTGDNLADLSFLYLRADTFGTPGAFAYFDNLKIGTTDGGTDVYTDAFEGDLSGWDDALTAATIITDPGIAPAAGGSPGSSGGRVFIAFDDGPLAASPSWTRIDGGTGGFPDQFVSGYDVTSGRQTLLSQTDTGTATVYINDHDAGLFDPRNLASPYFGKLDGRQILLQLYDPVAATWEDQFRGHIDEASYDIDGSAVDANGDPINASIQLDCVDLFAFLADYGLTPGLDGVTPRAVPSGMAGGAPPAGGEDGVWYATTTGTNDDRIIEILADVGIPPDMYGSPSLASGNTHVAAVKYDPDESALQALRDAADADLPFIANIFCDRHGKFQFHGRYARFDPDGVSAEPGSDWDFTRWAVGDGKAIGIDPSRAQMRILQYGRGRRDVINVATCYPQGLQPADMVNEIFANTASITAYGKHSAPPMSDLLLNPDEIQPVTGLTGKVECFRYAKLMVLNQKDPREAITALQLKAIQPDDDRAAATWALITRADISHIVNVAVGYPGGTGFTGASPDDDYYIEGRQLRVRPLNPTHDYVELDLEVSPAVWSMDTHSVFPPFSGDSGGGDATPILTAEFTVAT